MIFIWQGLPPPPFRTMESAQNKLCKVTSVRFTTSVIILSTLCDSLKPSHQGGRREIWPLQKMGSFNLSLKSIKKSGLFVIPIYSSKYMSAELCTIILIFTSFCQQETDPGTLVSACFICQFSCNIFLNYLLYVFIGWGTTFTCVPTHSFCCRRCEQ